MGDNSVLLGLSASDLEAWAIENGQPAFRGRQLYSWLYEKGAKELAEITVLPGVWRTALEEQGIKTGRLKLVKTEIASDQTTKLLLGTADNENIETVGIPTQNRLTVCVSSQVGCPMACKFCATGKDGLVRSLKAHEIVDQVLSVKEAMNLRPSHVVFMGMGEPLLNSDSVLSAINCINNDLGIGQRKITISTVGVPNTLAQLGELAIERLGRAQFTLAVSLHAPNQQLREMLIPTAKTYPLNQLLNDCRHYIDITGRRVTFEYILIGGVNDFPEHALELSQIVGGFQSHVNLIAYNPIEGEDFQRPSSNRIEGFRLILEKRGIAVSIRSSRGLDQNAACGQLRHQHMKINT